jgi:hypothetical protein
MRTASTSPKSETRGTSDGESSTGVPPCASSAARPSRSDSASPPRPCRRRTRRAPKAVAAAARGQALHAEGSSRRTSGRPCACWPTSSSQGRAVGRRQRRGRARVHGLRDARPGRGGAHAREWRPDHDAGRPGLDGPGVPRTASARTSSPAAENERTQAAGRHRLPTREEGPQGRPARAARGPVVLRLVPRPHLVRLLEQQDGGRRPRLRPGTSRSCARAASPRC